MTTLKKSALYPIAKPWGETYRLPMPSGAEVHVAFIGKGGKSSWHLHEHMVNTFFVVSGRLRIRQGVGGGAILKAGDMLSVETKNPHEFEALEDTVLVEAYGEPDIRRIRLT